MARSRVARRAERASPTPTASATQARASRRRIAPPTRSSNSDVDADDILALQDRSQSPLPHPARKSSRLKLIMVADIKRTVKLVTEQKILPDREAEVEGYPMRSWNIEVFLLNENGEEIPATIFNKVVYNLHPSFKNPIQTFTEAPFKCENEGWGEFDMTIDLFTSEKGGKNSIAHDLNFAKPKYESKHTVSFRNPSSALTALLRESGPVPGDDANGKRKDGDAKKRKRAQPVDFDKLGEALVKLNEDDLLHVVQMIHDNKSDDSYTKNLAEEGEFHVDLMSLPDSLIRMLWDYTQTRS